MSRYFSAYIYIFRSWIYLSPFMPRWILSSLLLSMFPNAVYNSAVSLAFILLMFCLEPDAGNRHILFPFIMVSLQWYFSVKSFYCQAATFSSKKSEAKQTFFSLALYKIRDNKNNVRYLVPGKHRRTGEALLNGISDNYIWCQSQVTL